MKSLVFFPGSLVLSCVLMSGTAAGQAWSADVLDPSAVDRASTGAVVPANELQPAPGKPQGLGLFPMDGTPPPPDGSMAQHYVFVRNGETIADWPPEAEGRIALVKIVDPLGPTVLFAQIVDNATLAGAVAVILISATTTPTAVAGTIPAANVQPADGELLVDLIDPSTDAEDPPNGAISEFPIRINPVFEASGPPAPIPPTVTKGAYHGTRVPIGVTPDFDGNPNLLASYGGPMLKAVIFPVGREAAEPTLGVNKNGTGFFAAATFDGAAVVLPRTVVMRSRDGGRTWEGISPPLPEPLRSEPPVSGDPMVYLEEDTGRIFSLDTYDADCMWLLFSDDEGETWSSNPVVCDAGGVTDHQTIFAGPPPAGVPDIDLLFPEILYIAYNTVALVPCMRSFDGGLTWTRAGTAYLGVETDHPGVSLAVCGGLTAHLRTDSAGRVFLPAARCGLPRISISEDAGLTWERPFVNTDIPVAGEEHETTLALDAADNLYITWWDDNDRLPYLAVSHDHGRTWSAPLMIAPPGVQEVNFPTIDAGDEGRVVIHFPGTVVADRSAQRPWNLYEVVSTNAASEDPLFVFTIANDPAHPVHRGDCGPGRCAGMFDFLDVVVPPAEVPLSSRGFWAAGVDTCNAACEQTGSAAGAMDGIVVRQVAGPALRKSWQAPHLSERSSPPK